MTLATTCIRAVIVDDEALGREGVRQRLAREADVVIVGEFAHAALAAAAIKDLEVDVVFLDIRMPGLDGFSLLAHLRPIERPAVVFVTAHDAHAVRAFTEHAADYLLKPLDDGRFADAVARVRERVRERRDADLGRRLAPLLGGGAAASYLQRFSVRENDHIELIPALSVDWIEAAGDYVRLHFAGRSRLHRASLSELVGRLDPATFIRTHRSAIVNLARVRQIEPWFHGESRLVLHNGTRVKVSRTHRAAVWQALHA